MARSTGVDSAKDVDAAKNEHSSPLSRKPKPRSILEYVKDRRLGDCTVCKKVPVALMAQVRDAMKRQRVDVETVLVWLEKEHGIKLTGAQWQTHRVGRHEQARRTRV